MLFSDLHMCATVIVCTHACMYTHTHTHTQRERERERERGRERERERENWRLSTGHRHQD
jgi:hypothetical protein